MVGADGATHHGVFDIAYLRCIPNLILFAPRNEIELRNIMFTVQKELNHPIAIRYPRGKGTMVDWEQPYETIEIGKGICLKEGNKIAVLSFGTVAQNVTNAISKLENQEIAHYDMRFAKPLDESLLKAIFRKFDQILTVEDGCEKGGFGSAILEFAAKSNYKNSIEIIGIPDKFIEHGSTEELQKIIGLDSESLSERIRKLIR